MVSKAQALSDAVQPGFRPGWPYTIDRTFDTDSMHSCGERITVPLGSVGILV